MNTFAALLTEEMEGGNFETALSQVLLEFLNSHEVSIQVHYSSLNYKDALSAIGHKGITKNFPHIPGIDASGTVISDTSNQFQVGQEVLVTGFDLGMNTNGGLSERISVPAQWVLPIPESLGLKKSMELGTAGLTAGLAVKALQENGVYPESGEIIVSGATGGVGMLSILLLKKLGYDIIALTGKAEASEFLLQLGAKKVMLRQEFLEDQKRAIYPMQFAGAIDTLGGEVLVKIIKSLKHSAAVAACGMASGTELNLQIYPFILRGARLIGIYSGDSTLAMKTQIWEKFANDWNIDCSLVAKEITLKEAPLELSNMLQGASFGRKLVNILGF
jgi:putative YhdH/YhfP family quinone oxidoreductase